MVHPEESNHDNSLDKCLNISKKHSAFPVGTKLLIFRFIIDSKLKLLGSGGGDEEDLSHTY